MSEADLDLKVQIRRLLWSWGMTTRVDVELRAVVNAQASGESSTETFTDIDVLGFDLTPMRVNAIVADCKTTQKRSIERVFWLRGMADYFGSADALLVREKEVAKAARALATRLDIAVLVSSDLTQLAVTTNSAVNLDGPLSCLFDRHAVEAYRARLHACDGRLDSLVNYIEFEYWLYEEHRNLQRCVSQLRQAAEYLNAKDPMHVSLFLSCVWLYVISIARAVTHLRRTHASEHVPVLQAYLFGGQAALQEKVQLSALLREATGRRPAMSLSDDVLPPYFDRLSEVVTRFAFRPHLLIHVARYAEFLSEAVVTKPSAGITETAFGSNYDPVTAKLLREVTSLLVQAAGLAPAFESRVIDLLDKT